MSHGNRQPGARGAFREGDRARARQRERARAGARAGAEARQPDARGFSTSTFWSVMTTMPCWVTSTSSTSLGSVAGGVCSRAESSSVERVLFVGRVCYDTHLCLEPILSVSLRMQFFAKQLLWTFVAFCGMGCSGQAVSGVSDVPWDASTEDSAAQTESSLPDGDAPEDDATEVETDEDAPSACAQPPSGLNCIVIGNTCLWTSDVGCNSTFCVCRPDTLWTCAAVIDPKCASINCVVPPQGGACAPWGAEPGDKCDLDKVYCECTADNIWFCDLK